MQYAGFWPRAISLVIDLLVWIPVTVLYWLMQGHSIAAAIIANLMVSVLGVAYPVYFHARWGQTLGKMAVKITVTKLDGTAITYRHAFLRSVVDIGLSLVFMVGTLYMFATLAHPDWASLSFWDRNSLIAERNPIDPIYTMASGIWFWSELVVLLLNKKKRALHDFIAGTVVVHSRLDAVQAVGSPPTR